MRLHIVQLICCFYLISIICSISQVVSGEDDDKTLQSSDSPQVSTSSRLSFKLPTKLLNFSNFQKVFKKHYASIVEQLARQKIFVARAFRVLASSINYKLAKSSSYLAINQMSDWTNEEMKQLIQLKPPQEESLPERLRRVKRSDNDDPSADGKSSGETVIIYDINDTVQTETELLSDISNQTPTKVSATELSTTTKKPDVMYIDHRNSGCVGRARGQGKCGSCWAFVAMAIYEWHYCKATGYLPTLSVQYPVDCGRGLAGNLDGCIGGNQKDVVSFVNQYGLRWDQEYPYVAYERGCPYDNQTLLHNVNQHLQMPSTGFVYFSTAELDEHLSQSPLAISIWVDAQSFYYYGGGVDQPINCRNSKRLIGGHEVLFVGSGSEDGQEYWLIRNSYGTQWGIKGYYKMSKKFPDCLNWHSMHRKFVGVQIKSPPGS